MPWIACSGLCVRHSHWQAKNHIYRLLLLQKRRANISIADVCRSMTKLVLLVAWFSLFHSTDLGSRWLREFLRHVDEGLTDHNSLRHKGRCCCTSKLIKEKSHTSLKIEALGWIWNLPLKEGIETFLRPVRHFTLLCTNGWTTLAYFCLFLNLIRGDWTF